MISILMPVYNAAPFLEDCLQSILNQTHQDWELLAVDDFSEDTSLAILKRYELKDHRVRVFQNSTKGIIPALQKAYEESTGQYITRMDADDKMMPDKLSLLHKVLINRGEGYLATGLVSYFSDTALGDGYQKYANWLNQLTLENRHFEEIYKECVIPSPAWMIARADLDRCAAFTAEQYPEDYDLCFRFYKMGLKVVGIPSIIHLWRDHPNRSSRTDSNYANNQYFNLKVPYFLTLDRDFSRPLVLWGAGKKGKTLAKLLLKENVAFRWVCNQSSKWGLDIYGVTMESVEKLEVIATPQVIIAVAGPEDQLEIKGQLAALGLIPNKDYYFFC